MVTEEKMREIAEKFFRTLTPKPSVGFRVSETKPGLYDCKLGGLPYFPKDMEYPMSEYDHPMRLLAQINFEKIPHIPDFPEKGILQFFILPDDLYGCDLDDLNAQKNFRVIYHKDIISDEQALLTSEEVADILEGLNDGDYGYMPFETADGFTLEPVLRKETYPISSELDIDPNKFVELYNRETGENLDNFGDFYADMNDDDPDAEAILCETMRRLSGGYFLAYTGSYAEFTQADPRLFSDDFRKYDTVLFEMLSTSGENADSGEPEIMWGDCGTGAFLIPREKLIACDFSDILYNYDCC